MASSGGKFFLRNAQTTYKRIPPSRNPCRMEFLNQTAAAVFVTKSLLLKLSKHVDYTLIDDKDKCCLSVTSTLPVHGTK